jgi:hypothetical protein
LYVAIHPKLILDEQALALPAMTRADIAFIVIAEDTGYPDKSLAGFV